MALEATLTVANVMHKRLRPRQHSFNYKVYYLYFPLRHIQKLANRFLSIERWNLLSFYRRDHGARDGSDLEVWARAILQNYGIKEADGEIMLLTLPRVLGYVFNPVSFWFCLDHSGHVRAVISEVSNTFGEHHSYISYHDDHRVILPSDQLHSVKVFHVSPFLAVNGYYNYQFQCTESRLAASVNHYDDQGLMLATSVAGTFLPLTSKNVIRMFLSYPLVTLKVMGLIHFEAVRLALKGIRYFRKPLPPQNEVTR